MSYDAWGNRRDPISWSVYATAPSGLITDRGFTGHEHIDLFDLVNMDGRVYDPVIGRFLSADPVIQDTENLQSLNRYSYCGNNPLSLTDPSGYSWLSNSWRSLLSAAIAITVSIVSLGTATALSAIILAGGAGGFAGGFSGVLLNGGNLGQALVAGVIGGAIGGATAFLSCAAGGVEAGISKTAAVFERAAKHAFADAWLGGVKSAIYGGEWSPIRDMIGGALSSAGNGLINDNVNGLALKMASSAVLGGTISEIGGGKFANGAITGAYSMLFNDLMHNVAFKDKEKAYKYMIAQSLSSKHEVAGAELIDGRIIVFKELGNKSDESNNYFVDKAGKVFVKINGELVEAIHEIHTHPGYYTSNNFNPLNVSVNDIGISSNFGNEIRILMTQSKTLYSVSTNGNGLIYPQKIWQGK